MTKAAIAHLTQCLAVEWGPFNVNVNAVAPTFIRTPGTQKRLENGAFCHDLLCKIPLGRVGEPIDVAGAVVFLASPAASLINGATLLIDGGFTSRSERGWAREGASARLRCLSQSSGDSPSAYVRVLMGPLAQ